MEFIDDQLMLGQMQPSSSAGTWAGLDSENSRTFK